MGWWFLRLTVKNFGHFTQTVYIIPLLDFHSTKRALWLVDSWSRTPDQIQMYPDWDTIVQLLPARRIQQHIFATWLLKGKSRYMKKHLMHGLPLLRNYAEGGAASDLSHPICVTIKFVLPNPPARALWYSYDPPHRQLIGSQYSIISCLYLEFNGKNLVWCQQYTLNVWSWGKQDSFVFPRVLMFPETKSLGPLGKQNYLVSLGTVHQVYIVVTWQEFFSINFFFRLKAKFFGRFTYIG